MDSTRARRHFQSLPALPLHLHRKISHRVVLSVQKVLTRIYSTRQVLRLIRSRKATLHVEYVRVKTFCTDSTCLRRGGRRGKRVARASSAPFTPDFEAPGTSTGLPFSAGLRLHTVI